MKFAVTGCAGFIGANFTAYLLDRTAQDTVVGIDCLTYAANRDALQMLRSRRNFAFYQANICDRDAIERIFERERPDAVIHFAAESHVDRSISDARIFVETNVLGTQTLLDAALKYGVGRFHQISTDEVYGDLPLDSDGAFTEASPLRPSSPYSASKAAADLLVMSYYKTHGLPVSISRSSNNYGAYQHAEKLIPTVIRQALHNEPIPVYGDGQNIRDWVYVEDHCRAIELIVREGTVGEIYNVGGMTSCSNLELVGEIVRRLGRSDALISFVEDRKGHDRKYALDCTKLRRALGWEPRVSFSDGLQRTVDWYLASASGCAKEC